MKFGNYYKKRLTKLLFIFAFCSSLPFQLFSQTNRQFNKLDSLFSYFENTGKLSMGSFAIRKNDSLIYIKRFGGNPVSTEIVNSETRYRIGSLTKVFTATLIFQLAEEGKIQLSTTLDAFFPQIPNAGKITIEELLNHRSGLFNFNTDPAYQKIFDKPLSKEQMLSFFSTEPPYCKPGEKTIYSNTNYVLLGYIVEEITKKKYGDVLKLYITNRLKLKNTLIGGNISRNNNETQSYQFKNGLWTLSPETNLSIVGGAGNIISTSSDLSIFMTALFNEKLISKKNIRKMVTIKDGYGLGLTELPFYDFFLYGDIGKIDQFYSGLFDDQKGNLAISFTLNGMSIAANDFVIAVLSIVYDKPYVIPNSLSNDLTSYEGVYKCTTSELLITIKKENSTLTARVTDQAPFPLTIVSKTKFTFAPAQVVLDFEKAGNVINKLTLDQAGVKYTFKKE